MTPSNLPADHSERMARARLSLEGLAIGDALGEMLAYNCANARRMAELGFHAGPWWHTDDTEMALGIYEVLERLGLIDPGELAVRFAERFRRDPDRGYGMMARRILQQILAGENWRAASQGAFEGQGSMGNGGAMRVAPLGAYLADEPDSIIRAEATLSAIVTHAHREGQAGAIAVAAASATAWRLRGQPKETASRSLLKAALDLTPDGETREGIRKAMELPFTKSSRDAAHVLGNGMLVTAQDTVPFAIWCAAKNIDDYREAIIETVLGDGDCDTNCAMVGGIVALFAGRDSIPPDWREARERFDFEKR
ncbi:MAG TPA: ADP-ribosylglycohydrolase family protein [Chthoniobacteraceae bacterium]|nr:ADP-ribosylglycohydrolase family protein [Chthoniobacteraceae bacterium]